MDVMKSIKAISIWQPWASLIATGAKQYETRHWSTNHRGLLAIHAAKRWTYAEFLVCQNFRYRFDKETQPLADWPEVELPLGAVLCIANLVDVIPTIQLDELSAAEREFGNFYPGRFAWKLEIVEVFATPIPAKGAQGLWWWTWEGGA